MSAAREALRRAALRAAVQSSQTELLDLTTICGSETADHTLPPEWLSTLQSMAAERIVRPPTNAAAALDVVYINLEARTDRRQVMQAQFESAHLCATRLCACTGDDAPLWACAATYDSTHNARFDRNTIAQRNVRATSGERGCAMSHVLLWAEVAARPTDSAPLLVLEDDVLLGEGFAASCAALIAAVEAAITPEQRQLLLYVGADVASWKSRRACQVREPHTAVELHLREALHVWQTSSYVVWPAAARTLLRALPVGGSPDVHISRLIGERRLAALVVVPSLAKQGGSARTHELFGPGDVGNSAARPTPTPTAATDGR